MNWSGGIIPLLGIISTKLYVISVLGSIALPVIILLIVAYYKGLIEIHDDKDDSESPNVYFAIVMCSGILLLKGMYNYNILDYTTIWAPSISIGITMLLLMGFGTKELRFRKLKDFISTLLFILLFLSYGFGSTMTLNCIYDESIPKEIQPIVINKTISSGKPKTYCLELTPWDNREEHLVINVSKELYNKTEIHSPIRIHLKKGLLGAPWLLIKE